jgi:hypothetical protein
MVLVSSTTAFAQGGGQDDTSRAAARAAGYEGVHAYEKGDLATAVDKLGRAFGVVKVPTLGLWYARALAKTGKLVEAAERYGEVMRLEVTEGKLKEQKQAQADAASELEALQPLIPTLTMNLVGATQDCELTLDGKPVSPKLIGLAAPLNPGAHRVRAKRGDEVVEESVTLATGEKKVIELRLSPTDPASSEPPESATDTGTNKTDNRLDASAGSKGSKQRTIGWVSLGLGGVAAIASAAAGILVLSTRKQLDDGANCNGTVCLSTERDRLETYNRMRTLSTVGLVVGAVGLGAGTTLLLTAPKPKEPGVTAWVGIGSMGVRGSF